MNFKLGMIVHRPMPVVWLCKPLQKKENLHVLGHKTKEGMNQCEPGKQNSKGISSANEFLLFWCFRSMAVGGLARAGRVRGSLLVICETLLLRTQKSPQCLTRQPWIQLITIVISERPPFPVFN